MLVFIDESGYPRPTDATDNPVLLAVCLHENDIKSITNQIYKLKDSIYGKQDEIKSTKLIREATITKNRTKNRAYVEGMIDIILSYDAAIFAIIMDKPTKKIYVPEHHLPKQYYLLLKRLNTIANIEIKEKLYSFLMKYMKKLIVKLLKHLLVFYSKAILVVPLNTF